MYAAAASSLSDLAFGPYSNNVDMNGERKMKRNIIHVGASVARFVGRRLDLDRILVGNEAEQPSSQRSDEQRRP